MYAIPQIIALYAPIFESFSQGTNIVHDWKLATQGKPTGTGRQLCKAQYVHRFPFLLKWRMYIPEYLDFLPTQWNNILEGLANFGSSATQSLSTLNYMQFLIEYQLDNLQKGEKHTIGKLAIGQISACNTLYDLHICKLYWNAVMSTKKAKQLDDANDNLATSIQGIHAGLQLILSVRTNGADQLQTSSTCKYITWLL